MSFRFHSGILDSYVVFAETAVTRPFVATTLGRVELAYALEITTLRLDLFEEPLRMALQYHSVVNLLRKNFGVGTYVFENIEYSLFAAWLIDASASSSDSLVIALQPWDGAAKARF